MAAKGLGQSGSRRFAQGVAVVAVHVISLCDSPRRPGMAAQLDAVLGLDWQFFDALRCLPAEITYDPATARRTIRRELTPGELGCFASHAAMWRVLLDSDADAIVVLEDDLLIDPGFFAELPRIVVALSGHPFVRLYAKAPTSARIIGRVANRHVVRYRGVAIGNQGYILRRAAATRWAEAIRAAVRPIDDEMERYWAHGIANIGLHPFPIIELIGPSSIEEDRRGLPPARWTEFGWQSRRITDSVRRRLANMVA
jgi:glycosyl transferase family 25